MKKWKVIFYSAAAVVIFFSIAYIFLLSFGKSILVKKLQDLTGKSVSIGELRLGPALNLEIKNLKIQGLAEIAGLSLSPSLVRFLTGRIVFNRIVLINPVFTLERSVSQDSKHDPAQQMAFQAGASVPAKAAAAPNSFQLFLKRLSVRAGRINFIDHTVGPQGIRITVKDLNFDLVNFCNFGCNTRTSFDLKGSIPWETNEPDGKLSFKGWMNLYKKDMRADLVIKNIDGIALYEYYATWVDLGKARIEKAKLNFNSEIRGQSNNLTADCHLELVDIVRKPRAPDETKLKAEKITDAVLDMFKTLDQGKVVLDFKLNTRMDRPEFGFANIKSAFEGKLMQARSAQGFKKEDVIMLPKRILETGIRSATDLSRALMDGIFAIGNQLKKVLEESLKKNLVPAS